MTAKKIPTRATKAKQDIVKLGPLSNAIAEFAEARRNASFPISAVPAVARPVQQRAEPNAAKWDMRRVSDASKEPKHMTKKEVLKLVAGTWIELWWNGATNTMALLLERIENRPGDVSVKCMHFDTCGHITGIDSHTIHSQIVATHGMLHTPVLDDDWEE